MFSPVLVSDSQRPSGPRRVETFNCGAVEVPESAIVRLVEPLSGLGGDTEFLVYRNQPGPLSWWQAASRKDLAFCALEPFAAGLDPDITIDQQAVDAIGASGPEDIVVFTVVVLDPDQTQIRTNLRAPILVCRSSGRGMQVVLDDPRLPVKAYLADLVARAAKGG